MYISGTRDPARLKLAHVRRANLTRPVDRIHGTEVLVAVNTDRPSLQETHMSAAENCSR